VNLGLQFKEFYGNITDGNSKIKMTVENTPNLDIRFILGHLLSGELVVDRYNSHSHHESDLLERALSKVDSRDRGFVAKDVDMGEQVGVSTCVETRDKDEIIYAYRPKRNGPTRFVMDREPMPSDSIVVILKRDEDPRKMVLISSWVGHLNEPEPWDPHATENSQTFWNSHALIWGSETIDSSKPIIKEQS
jgi:hypothetical protein